MITMEILFRIISIQEKIRKEKRSIGKNRTIYLAALELKENFYLLLYKIARGGK